MKGLTLLAVLIICIYKTDCCICKYGSDIPEIAVCRNNVVIILNVTQIVYESTNNTTLPVNKKIAYYKADVNWFDILKGNKALRNILKLNKMKISIYPSTVCGKYLNLRVKYLIATNIDPDQDRININICTYIKELSKLTKLEREGFLNDNYFMADCCEIFKTLPK